MGITDFVDLKTIIMMLGLDLTEKGNSFTGLCPFHQEKTPSFSIKKEGYYKCFGCGVSGSINKLVYEITGKSAYKFFNIQDKESYFFQIAIQQKIAPQQEKKSEINLTVKGNLRSPYCSEEIITYLSSRNVNKYMVDYFDIKYCDNAGVMITDMNFKNRIMIPIYENGLLIGYEGRDYAKKQKKKVLYTKGNCVSSLFNIDFLDKEKPLIICEGFFDLPLIFQNITENCTHSFGTAISSKQKDLINEFKDVTLFCDNDLAGLNGILEFDKFYKNEFWIAIPEKEDQDPGDLNLEEIKKCLNNKVLSIEYLIDKNNLFENKNMLDWQ